MNGSVVNCHSPPNVHTIDEEACYGNGMLQNIYIRRGIFIAAVLHGIDMTITLMVLRSMV